VSGWSPERIASRARRPRRAGPGLDARSVIEAGRPGAGPAACRCERCGGGLRYPTRRIHAAGPVVTVAMRCPDCGSRSAEELGPQELDALERADEEAEAALAVALTAVVERRRHEDLRLLISCLREDAILPEDF
jgi:hypothetical protein